MRNFSMSRWGSSVIPAHTQSTSAHEGLERPGHSCAVSHHLFTELGAHIPTDPRPLPPCKALLQPNGKRQAPEKDPDQKGLLCLNRRYASSAGLRRLAQRHLGAPSTMTL